MEGFRMPMASDGDIPMTAVLVLAAIGFLYYRLSRLNAMNRLAVSERRCRLISMSVLAVNEVVFCTFLFGWLFLDVFPVRLAIWPIWQLGYLLGAIALVWVLPALILCSMLWACVGWLSTGFDKKTVAWGSANIVVLIANMLLYIQGES